MPKYDGASIYYTETLTQYEQKYCEYRAAGIPQIESYKRAYINVDCEKMSRDTIQTRCSKIEKKEKVIKRITELKELQKVKNFTDNQTEAEPFEVFENNPKKTMFYLLWNFMNDCKVELKRADQFKAIESIAKLYNLYSDGSITNNQLNQIIIQAPDVNKAIESITDLVNQNKNKYIDVKPE